MAKRKVSNKPKCGPEGWVKMEGTCIVCKKKVKKFLRGANGDALAFCSLGCEEEYWLNVFN